MTDKNRNTLVCEGYTCVAVRVGKKGGGELQTHPPRTPEILSKSPRIPPKSVRKSSHKENRIHVY